MAESKIGDHAEFKDEDVEGHNERSEHAVTSRYNLVRSLNDSRWAVAVPIMGMLLLQP